VVYQSVELLLASTSLVAVQNCPSEQLPALPPVLVEA
jgi:hypothetical protein